MKKATVRNKQIRKSKDGEHRDFRWPDRPDLKLQLFREEIAAIEQKHPDDRTPSERTWLESARIRVKELKHEVSTL